MIRDARKFPLIVLVFPIPRVYLAPLFRVLPVGISPPSES